MSKAFNAENLDKSSDEKLAELSVNGNSKALEVLANRYKSFICAKSHSYFLAGADKDDLFQEGMIGLYKAIKDFRNDKNASFKTFAELCITRQVITAVKTATRLKHLPLNSYVSLNHPESGYNDTDNLQFEESNDRLNPEQMFIENEEVGSIVVQFSKLLSEMELLVLTYHLRGMSYIKIAEKLNKSPKSIDNALQRIKKKIEKYLGSRGN